MREHIQSDSLCLDNLQERPRTETKTHFFDLFEIQEVKEISQDIEVQFSDSNILEYKTIAQIFDASVRLSSKIYALSTNRNRKERRELLHKDLPAYQECVKNYNDEVDDMLDVALNQILKFLNIEKIDVFQESICSLLDRDLECEMCNLQAIYHQKIKKTMKGINSLSLDTMKKLLNEKINILTNKSEEMKQILLN